VRRSTGAELGATRCYRGEEKPVLPATVPGTILEMPLPGAGSASRSRSDEGWCLPQRWPRSKREMREKSQPTIIFFS